MKIRFRTSLFMTVLILSSSIVLAQQISNVAVFNPEKTMQLSVPGKQFLSQLVNKETEIRSELSGIDKKLLSLQQKYNTQKLTLSTEAEQQLLFDIEALRTTRTRREEDLAKEYRSFKFDLINKFYEEIRPVISSVAKEKGLAVVLDLSVSGVMYFDQAFDITDEVIARYNASKK